MVKFSLLLSYRGLPKSWEASGLELPAATQIKLKKAAKTIQETQNGGVVFVQGNPAILLNTLWDDNLESFTGLSFPKYFSSKMDKDLVTLDLKPRRYTFLYDIGDESAINKQFSGQLLRQLITDCKNDKVWCFVCANTTNQTFERDYGIKIVNSIMLPKETETKLI